MAADPTACVTTPHVSVWDPSWDKTEKQTAMQHCAAAVDELLAQVNIKVTRPDNAVGSQVLRLLNSTEDLEDWFDKNTGVQAVPMTFDREKPDSMETFVLFETSPGSSLSFLPLKLDGTPRAYRKQPASVALEVEHMKDFSYGEVYATDGFFNVPCDSASPGRMNRAFLSPLLGFMVVAELHASETVVNANTQKRFPHVLQYRIDLMFATTFGVTMKVRQRTGVPTFCSVPPLCSLPCSGRLSRRGLRREQSTHLRRAWVLARPTTAQPLRLFMALG